MHGFRSQACVSAPNRLFLRPELAILLYPLAAGSNRNAMGFDDGVALGLAFSRSEPGNERLGAQVDIALLDSRQTAVHVSMLPQLLLQIPLD